METIQDFFTASSIGTFTGATAAVTILTNTIRRLLKINSPWPAFIFALAVSFAGAFLSENLSNIVEYFLAFLNSCLLFCTALGIQESLVSVNSKKPIGGVKPYGKEDVKWLSSWLKK